MTKTILLTGATDGIGLETAKLLTRKGHRVLLHGRNPDKLNAVSQTLSEIPGNAGVETYVADMSELADVARLADAVSERHRQLDVLINNAGVFKTTTPVASNGLDVRFLVNAIAPYLLTKLLLPRMDGTGRVVNLSSAAQAPVDMRALSGATLPGDDFSAYAQSKLAITMWSRALADQLGSDGSAVIAVNPGSLLGTKMVKEGFETAGKDIAIGAEILCRAALSEDFRDASGRYFDNDSGRFSTPHPDATDPAGCTNLVRVIEDILARIKH